MKKPSIKLSGILIALLFLVVISCRKFNNENTTASTTNQSVAEAPTYSVKDARKYFYGTLRKYSKSELAIQSVGGKNKKLFPYWNKAYASSTKKFTFVEVPVASVHKQRILRSSGDKLTDEVTNSILAASFTRLIMYKNKRGFANERLVTYIPDYDYLKKHNNDISHNHIDKLDKDFSGYLEYRDWDNKLLFTLKFVNGAAVHRLNYTGNVINTSKLSINEVGSSKLKTNGCQNYLVTDWEQDCTDFTDPDNAAAGSVEICGPWYIADQYYETECDDDIDCSDPANFDNAECQGDEERILSSSTELSMDGDDTDDDDKAIDPGTITSGPSDANYQYSRIQYTYPVIIEYGEQTHIVTGVYMGDVQAHPNSETYYGIYNTNVTRTVTPITTGKYYNVAGGSVSVSWTCLVTLRYTYQNTGQTRTRSSNANYSSVVAVP